MSTNILNPFEIFAGEVPIMSFQTNLNGTFNPTLQMESGQGTPRWVIDGIEYIANVPNAPLTGSTVDVEVFANDIIEGADLRVCTFASEGIIGEISLVYFTISNNIEISSNPLLTSVVFSEFDNVATGNLNLNSNNLSIIDVSSFVEITVSQLLVNNNSNLETWILPTSGTMTVSSFIRCDFTLIESVDLSAFTLAGLVFIKDAPITALTFSTGLNTSNRFEVNDIDLFTSTLDFSSFTINGPMRCGRTNALNFIQPKIGSSTDELTLTEIEAISLDISNIECTGTVVLQSSSNLATVTPPIITTSLATYNLQICALNLATVNNTFAFINTFMSANAPIANLTVRTDGGTNASPTGGSSNTDLVNLRDVVYPNAGFTFTPLIN